MIIPHSLNPLTAFLHLGLEPQIITHADHYVVTLPEGVTEEQFNAALAIDPQLIYINISRKEAKQRIRETATSIIESQWPTWKQVNVSLGIYPEDKALECIQFIESIRVKVDELDAQIDSTNSIEQINSYQLT